MLELAKRLIFVCSPMASCEVGNLKSRNECKTTIHHDVSYVKYSKNKTKTWTADIANYSTRNQNEKHNKPK